MFINRRPLAASRTTPCLRPYPSIRAFRHRKVPGGSDQRFRRSVHRVFHICGYLPGGVARGEAETLGSGCSAHPSPFPSPLPQLVLVDKGQRCPRRGSFAVENSGERRGRPGGSRGISLLTRCFQGAKGPLRSLRERGRFYQRPPEPTIGRSGLSTGAAIVNPAFSTVSTISRLFSDTLQEPAGRVAPRASWGTEAARTEWRLTAGGGSVDTLEGPRLQSLGFAPARPPSRRPRRSRRQLLDSWMEW